MQPRPLPARGLAILLAVAIGVRLLLVGGASLVITNDSTEFLKVADAWYESAQGRSVITFELSPVRMEAYGWLLGAVFQLTGPSGLAVLITNHVLGVLTCLLVARIGALLGAPIAGVVAAITCALDPFLLAVGNFALSESLAFFLIVATAWAVLRFANPYVAVCLVGALLGTACMVRPAAQTIAPFMVLAVALRPGLRWVGRGALVALSLVPFLALVGPRLKANYEQGVMGLSPGFGGFQWVGVAGNGLLDADYDAPADLRSTLPPVPEDARFRWPTYMDFVIRQGGLKEREADFAAWARASIRARPEDYVRRLGMAVLWQLNWFPEEAPPDRIGEVHYLVRRAGEAGSTQYEPAMGFDGIERYHTAGSGGWVRAALTAFDGWRLPGTPQFGIFAISVLALLVALVRGSWPTVMILLASIAYLLAHAAMLVPWNRYMLPMYPLWYAGIAMLVAQIVAMTRRAPAPPPVAASAAAAGPAPYEVHP
ncbi:MAG: glycosyltransferase family 39 protein [Phycisphaerales bacterium]|nr:glycosyltransferase family 39 protein [Phycisphaerales bacterium]